MKLWGKGVEMNSICTQFALKHIAFHPRSCLSVSAPLHWSVTSVCLYVAYLKRGHAALFSVGLLATFAPDTSVPSVFSHPLCFRKPTPLTTGDELRSDRRHGKPTAAAAVCVCAATRQNRSERLGR